MNKFIVFRRADYETRTAWYEAVSDCAWGHDVLFVVPVVVNGETEEIVVWYVWH